MVLALCALLVSAAPLFAQLPSAQQIQQAQQALESGMTVTPEMIDAAQQQFPGLEGMSPDEIQKQAEEEERRKAEAKSKEAALIDEQFLDQEKEWVSRRDGHGRTGTDNERDRRFPPGLRRFGHDFFQNADVAGLGPNAPSLPDYVLSPGDEIQVSTWGRDSRSASVVIDNEGMFHYPPLSPMRIAGLKFAAAEQRIVSEIQKIHGVTAAVSLGRLRSIRIMVLGEAVRPGSYAIPAGATVTSALFRSGGVTSIGSLRNIEVRRNGKTVATLDLYDMLLKGASKSDIQLVSGDAIFIPLATRQVAVHGMVKRPAIYELKGDVKALQAVDLAGGLLSNAFKGRLQLDRVQGNKRNIVLDVDMDQVDKGSNVALIDGDILFVDKVLDKLDEAVFLKGNVHRPGRYQYKPGMTVRDLIPSLRDLKSETFFEYSHIQRPAPDDERPMLLNFSLGDVFTKGARVPLEPRDTVVIYNRYQLVERPVVKAGGMVRKPGQYSFRESMTVSDLIILAGGLGDAHLPEAHLLRTLYEAESDSMFTQLLKVSLRKVLEDPASEDNLELRPFDSLIVFPRSSFVLPKWVSIYGAVRKQGTFELAQGMGIAELVSAAGGLTKNSFRLNVEVVRRQIVGDSIMTREVQKMPLKDVMEGNADFELADGDGIYIREVVNAKEFTTVSLTGEFAFPGKYEFTTGEKLSSVIKRAGGFTDQAYLRGLVFIRRSVKEQQMQHAEEIGRRLEDQLQTRMQQTVEDSERARIRYALERRQTLVKAIREAPYLGRVVIQLDEKYKFEGTDWDITLEHGDSLYVGAFPNTVSILGEVYSPTNIIYTSNSNTVGEALAKAGGVNNFGDYKNTFYIGPDGVVHTPGTTPWYMSFKWKSIEPGGSIIVPAKPPAKDYLEIVAKATQILFQIAVTAGVVMQLY
jgi:polysaccharide export outer membrane protein